MERVLGQGGLGVAQLFARGGDARLQLSAPRHVRAQEVRQIGARGNLARARRRDVFAIEQQGGGR